MHTPTPRHNLERKCRHADLEAARLALVHLRATCEGVQEQCDTYLNCPNGRLKLRCIAGAHAELIWYDRASESGVRESTYHRTAVGDSAALLAALECALGKRGEVRKRREVWHWQNVRIHLDEVDGLGSFIEFEAILDADTDEARALVRLETLGAALALDPAADVAGSYADLRGL